MDGWMDLLLLETVRPPVVELGIAVIYVGKLQLLAFMYFSHCKFIHFPDRVLHSVSVNGSLIH